MKSTLIKSVVALLSILFLLSFSSKVNEIDDSESYFPLTIKEKKVRWFNTQYIERQIGEKKINNKTYKVFEQEWKNGQKDSLYLREENGVVYQYQKEEDNHEYVRYDNRFKKNATWGPSIKPKLHKITSFNGTLETPYGKFTDLMVIEAKFDNGKFKFYYQKGMGYIGATTKKEGLISYLRE